MFRSAGLRAGLSTASMALVAATVLTVVVAVTASAQPEFPRRTVKFVVPVPPGPMLDTLPRLIGEKLAARWNQPVIVENRPGAASNLGAEAVAKSEPDGYTLLVTPPGPLVVSQHIYPKLGFDPAAFVPVTTLVRFPFILVVNPKLQAASFPELIARAKANPGKITFASPGVSSTPHLGMERFAAAAGIRFVHVPYPGLAPALRDLIAGHVDAMFDTPGNILSHVANGDVRALAVTGEARIPELPETPTIAEILPGILHTDWFAVVAPPKTPADIATLLSGAIADAMKLPDVAKRIAAFNVTAVGNSPADTGAMMRREAEQYRTLIQSAGIKPQ